MYNEKKILNIQVNIQNLTMENQDFVLLAENVAEYIKQYNPSSVIDFGCGAGVYSEIIRQKGMNVYAQEISKPARDYCKKSYPDLKVIARPKKSELMLFIEVAEHMTDEEIEKALTTIDPKYVLFSSTSTIGKDAGPFNITEEDWGHINIKPQGDWVKMFESMGYWKIDNPGTPTTYAIMFKKR